MQELQKEFIFMSNLKALEYMRTTGKVFLANHRVSCEHGLRMAGRGGVRGFPVLGSYLRMLDKVEKKESEDE